MRQTVYASIDKPFSMRASQRRNLEAVLALHAGRYPRMEPTDAVKLVYQSVFGGGHLVSDEAESLRRLSAERVAAVQGAAEDSRAASFEPIGFGFVRLYLTGRELSPLPDALLNRAFVLSSRAPHGETPLFEASLLVLQRAVKNGMFPFSAETFADYLAEYRAAGRPIARHSESYRRAYAPAYRVLSGPYASALDVLCQAGGCPPQPELLYRSCGLSPQTRKALSEILLYSQSGG